MSTKEERDLAAKKARELRKERTEAGVCTKCGGERDRPDRKRCAECRQKKNDATRKEKEEADAKGEPTSKMKQCYEQRKQRLAAGLCQMCGQQPHEDGRASCAACLAKYRDKVQQHRDADTCKTCGEPKEKGRSHCPACLAKMAEQKKVETKKIRDEVFSAYGGYRCQCPGCDATEPDFMQIDHVNNDGAEHRKSLPGLGAGLYRWLKNNNYPPGFTVLCASCNHSKGKKGSGGKCIHVRKLEAAGIDPVAYKKEQDEKRIADQQPEEFTQYDEHLILDANLLQATPDSDTPRLLPEPPTPACRCHRPFYPEPATAA